MRLRYCDNIEANFFSIIGRAAIYQYLLELCRNDVGSLEEALRNCHSNKNAETGRLRKLARGRCNAILRRQKFLHEQAQSRKVLSYQKGSKNFWSFVKQIKNIASQSIFTLLKNDVIFTDQVDKANLFAELFSWISTPPRFGKGVLIYAGNPFQNSGGQKGFAWSQH